MSVETDVGDYSEVLSFQNSEDEVYLKAGGIYSGYASIKSSTEESLGLFRITKVHRSINGSKF